jgi:hypothetical protein
MQKVVYISKRLSKAGYFTVILLSGVFFFLGVHSVDIAHSEAIHHNDWNKAKMSGEKGYLDLRNYEDCNLLGCHRYATFYMSGMSLIVISFIVLFAIVLWQGVCRD